MTECSSAIRIREQYSLLDVLLYFLLICLRGTWALCMHSPRVAMEVEDKELSIERVKIGLAPLYCVDVHFILNYNEI